MASAPLNWLLKIGGDALQTVAQTLSGAINELKSKFTFDNAPTSGSDNLLTSGTVYTAVDGINTSLAGKIDNPALKSDGQVLSYDATDDEWKAITPAQPTTAWGALTGKPFDDIDYDTLAVGVVLHDQERYWQLKVNSTNIYVESASYGGTGEDVANCQYYKYGDNGAPFINGGSSVTTNIIPGSILLKKTITLSQSRTTDCVFVNSTFINGIYPLNYDIVDIYNDQDMDYINYYFAGGSTHALYITFPVARANNLSLTVYVRLYERG